MYVFLLCFSFKDNLLTQVACCNLHYCDQTFVAIYLFTKFYSLFVGEETPSLKYLNRYVRGSVGSKWHDLGIELLDPDDVKELNRIKAQYSLDLNECCKEMFQLWLSKKSNASWNQLIKALRQPGIELDTLAGKVEQLLEPKPKPG